MLKREGREVFCRDSNVCQSYLGNMCREAINPPEACRNKMAGVLKIVEDVSMIFLWNRFQQRTQDGF